MQGSKRLTKAQWLYFVRKFYQYSQDEIGRVAGISGQAIGTWERGSTPRMANWEALERAIGLKYPNLPEPAPDPELPPGRAPRAKHVHTNGADPKEAQPTLPIPDVIPTRDKTFCVAWCTSVKAPSLGQAMTLLQVEGVDKANVRFVIMQDAELEDAGNLISKALGLKEE